MRRVVLLVVSCVLASAASAGTRVALVIGQDAYPGGKSATVGLPPLANPGNDARKVVTLLGKNGFEVMSCDGKKPGCFDLDRAGLLKALADFKTRSNGADSALVYFAGHGMASPEGNILTPVDARVVCETGDVTNAVPVEMFLEATAPARHKLVVLDACRNNPLGEICPGLAAKKLGFSRIEAGAMQGLLLVTSTQFGQEALDGPLGANSPFAMAFLDTLADHPDIYFEQVMNEVGRVTYEAAQMESFQQIPGKIVGTPAPADCLAGRGCIGDIRMAALAQENEKLTADAATVRNILADDERARGKPYTAAERQAAVERIGRSLTSLAGSAEPKVKAASELFAAGKVAEGRAKLDEALDDDDKAAAEIERMGRERRKSLARNARDAAGLAKGTDIVKALAYYERATRNDPDVAQTWNDYARAAMDAGRLDVAKAAFEQAAARARDPGQALLRYWATIGLGDVAKEQGSLPGARRFYETAAAIIAPLAHADPDNLGWQRELSLSYDTIGDVLLAEGSLPEALKSFRDGLVIAERLARADPGNGGWQRDLSVSYNKVGDVLVAQGSRGEALKSFRDGLAIAERLTKADPGNSLWQRDLSVSYNKVGNLLVAQGDLPAALKSYRDGLARAERLVKSDPGNAGWQSNLSVSYDKIGDVLLAQGNRPEALQSYRDSLAIRELLAKASASNLGWQRNLSVSYDNVGDVLVAQGDLPESLKSYRYSLAIRERLTKADPGNRGWQRDLAVSYTKVGALLVAHGKLPEALKSYRDGLAIVERLARFDPLNAGWQRDLAVSYTNVGDVLVAQDDLQPALQSFRDSLAIRDRLAKADPGNSGWQRDLSLSHDKIGKVLEKLGRLDEAAVHYQRDLEIAEKLAAVDPTNAVWRRDAEISRARMARLRKP